MLKSEQLLPSERVELSAGPITDKVDDTPKSTKAPDTPKESEVKTTTSAAKSPTTLFEEAAPGQVSGPEDPGMLGVVSSALTVKNSSEAHWTAALEAFGKLPDADKAAAGKRAFYSQAAMLPEFAQTREGLTAEQLPFFPQILMNAKDSGAIDGGMLESRVKQWSEENPEQAYVAQMTGFADFAGEQVAATAAAQGVTSVNDLAAGPREKALLGLAAHGNGYVSDRNAFLGSVNRLVQQGHTELAGQLMA